MPDSTLDFFFQFLAIQNVQKRRYLVVFSTHGGGLALGNSLGAFWHKQDPHGCQHDLQILNQAGMCNVHQIHLQLVIGSSIVLAVHLCITGQTGLGLQAQGEFRHLLAVLGGNFRAFRAGADDG